jgi:hypothetical protein
VQPGGYVPRIDVTMRALRDKERSG